MTNGKHPFRFGGGRTPGTMTYKPLRNWERAGPDRMTVTRREFIGASAAGAVAACVAGGLASAEWTISARARSLVDGSYVLDGTVQPASKSGQWTMAPGGLKRLTGIDAGGWTMREAVLEEWRHKIQKYPEAYTLILNAEDLRSARDARKYGVLMYFQKDYELGGNASKLEEWYTKGLRIFQPTYADTNELGGGQNDDATGLTALGKQAVRECNRLGIVVDVSHCGHRTTMDVLEVSESAVTANHCNADAIARTRRNKSDEELLAIAQSGGVIGAVAIGLFLEPDGSGASIGSFLDQVEYLVDLAGPNAVGIASDSYMDGQHDDARWYSDRFLNCHERWYYVTQGLIDRGFDDDAIARILGQNFYEVYEAIL